MPVIEVVCDASVVLKWFQAEGEDDVRDARSLLAAHRDGRIVALILDLTLYEVANVLIRALGRSAEQTATVLEAIDDICVALPASLEDRRLAARIAEEQALSFYDAAYVAVAEQRGAALATADRQLLDTDVGQSPSALARQLELTGTI